MKFAITFLALMFIGSVTFSAPIASPSPAPKEVKQAKVEVKKAKKDAVLTSEQLAEVDGWIAGKVKSKDMTKKQGEDAMKHADALYKVMMSEKKPKKGDKKNGN